MKNVLIFIVTVLVSCQAAISIANEMSLKVETFVVQHRGVKGEKGRFIVRTSDPAVIEKARKELAKPEADRQLFVNGQLASGDGKFNSPWHWHIEDGKWNLVEKSIELCDGTPEMVEKDVKNWIQNNKRFCPWKSFVLEEKK